MSTNIPLGTYVSDGVRTGPFYTGQLPQGFVADNNGVITSSSHDTYGPGVLLSTQNTWDITPAAPNPVGFTTLNNLVNTTGVGTVTGAGNLILLGDNSVTYLNNGVVQFDWPRVVTVTITGADVTAGTHITVFGTDWYDMPMQQTYVFSGVDIAPGTYPKIDIAGSRVVYPISNNPFPTKAFYTVNRVFISGALPPLLTQISLGCADAFGLPYRTNNAGDITSIGWGKSPDLGVVALGQIVPLGIFIPADSSAATATTGDVRGFYSPSDAADNTQNLRFTYYVRGANTWINQVANTQQIYMQQTGFSTPEGVPVAPLTLNDLVGVPQFYTGIPT